jgi:hypothetical protein
MSPVGHASETATISVKCRLEVRRKFVGVVNGDRASSVYENNMAPKCCKKKLLIIDNYVSNYYELIPNIFQSVDGFLESFQDFMVCCS